MHVPDLFPDIRNTKASLNELGYFDEEIDNDFIIRTLDTNIKSFQKDNDLKVDGKLYPNGETENSIIQNLASSQLLPVAASTYSSQAETRSPAIASFGQVAENVDATGRMIQDQTASTQSLIQAEEPQQSEMPEEQNEPQSDTRNECASLSIDLQNAWLFMDDCSNKKLAAETEITQVSDALVQAERELMKKGGKQFVDTAIGASSKGPLGIAGAATGYYSNKTDVDAAKQKVEELKARYELLEDTIKDMERWIEKTRAEIKDIKAKMQEKGCA